MDFIFGNVSSACHVKKEEEIILFILQNLDKQVSKIAKSDQKKPLSFSMLLMKMQSQGCENMRWNFTIRRDKIGDF